MGSIFPGTNLELNAFISQGTATPSQPAAGSLAVGWWGSQFLSNYETATPTRTAGPLLPVAGKGGQAGISRENNRDSIKPGSGCSPFVAGTRAGG